MLACLIKNATRFFALNINKINAYLRVHGKSMENTGSVHDVLNKVCAVNAVRNIELARISKRRKNERLTKSKPLVKLDKVDVLKLL